MSNTDEICQASVIIPSYGQREHISKVLDSLQNQVTKYNYEIIVIESSGDGTADLVRQKYPEVRIIELRTRAFPGIARNVGIKAAQSDILLFTDTDCVVDRNWIQKMVEGQLQGKYALGGLVLNGTSKNIIGITDYLLEFYEFISHKSQVIPAPVPTCNVSYHKQLFIQHGYFENHIKGSDSIFSRKIEEAGQLIFWDPEIKIWHTNRTSLKKIKKNQYDLGLGAALSRRKYPYRGRIFVKCPFLVIFMPFLRSLNIGWKLLLNSPVNFIRFILVYPIIIIGLISYAKGFFHGLEEKLDERRF